jgi:hypothetical protein
LPGQALDPAMHVLSWETTGSEEEEAANDRLPAWPQYDDHNQLYLYIGKILWDIYKISRNI